MIPDYQTLMLPVLEQASDEEINTRDVIERLAEKYELTDEERELLLPSGKQRTFENRVHWAIRYNIGCRDEEILHLKKVDEEFFE